MIWYLMKCLCHNYMFLSNFYNNNKGINRCVRCPLKHLWDVKWSQYFNLSVIISETCRVRKDKKWKPFQRHVHDRSEKDIWHHLIALFISYTTQFIKTPQFIKGE